MLGDEPALSRDPLVLRGELTISDVWTASTEDRALALGTEALAAVARNEQVLTKAIASGTPIYGITTGFGALVEEQVPIGRLRESQLNLLRSHAAGTGAPLPPEVVRAAMIVRVNGLLQARSGVRPLVLQRIVDLLNAGMIPITPRTGSLGASGDLAPSAHAFLPLIGEGTVVDRDGRTLTGEAALQRLGWAPLVLEGKEGLALINGTHFMAGIGALISVRIARVLDTADAAAAMTLVALNGSVSALDPRVHALRGLSGQIRSAGNIRRLSSRTDGVRSSSGLLQDAYSLRCAAQVHGASREAAAFFDRIVAADLNAATDNPLVFEDDPQIVSAGNFHGQTLALAFDAVRVAIADLASISERRVFRLLSPSLSRGLPAFLTPEPGTSSGYMVAQYTAAALLAELRALAHPVSCDSVPTSDNQEDHVSMGMTAALMALDSVERVETVHAIELLCATQALDHRGDFASLPTAAIYDVVRARIDPLVADRPPAADIEAATQLVRSGSIAALVGDSDTLERVVA